jgi:hypothetical protein
MCVYIRTPRANPFPTPHTNSARWHNPIDTFWSQWKFNCTWFITVHNYFFTINNETINYEKRENNKKNRKMVENVAIIKIEYCENHRTRRQNTPEAMYSTFQRHYRNRNKSFSQFIFYGEENAFLWIIIAIGSMGLTWAIFSITFSRTRHSMLLWF